MEAKRVDKIPTGDVWQFEPKVFAPKPKKSERRMRMQNEENGSDSAGRAPIF